MLQANTCHINFDIWIE